MPSKPPFPPSSSPDRLTLKIGNWLQADASGRGVIAIPVVVLLLAVAAIVRFAFF